MHHSINCQPSAPNLPTQHALYLEDSEQSLGESVKSAALGLGLIKVELATKELHSQQGEDDDEEEK